MTDASLRRAAEITVSACHLDTLHGENLGSTSPSWGARGENGPPNAAWPRKTRKGSYLQVRGNNDCITAGQSGLVDNFKKIFSFHQLRASHPVLYEPVSDSGLAQFTAKIRTMRGPKPFISDSKTTFALARAMRAVYHQQTKDLLSAVRKRLSTSA